MSEYTLKTQVLAPEDEKSISFTMKHPSKFFKIIPSLMKETFKISSSHFYEDRIKWDVGDTSVQFFGVWRCDDSKDGRSIIWAQIKLQGEQNLDQEKMGNATVLLSATLETNFPYRTILDKSVYKTYTYLYYNQQRRYYIEEAKQRLLHIENQIKKTIGINI